MSNLDDELQNFGATSAVVKVGPTTRDAIAPFFFGFWFMFQEVRNRRKKYLFLSVAGIFF